MEEEEHSVKMKDDICSNLNVLSQNLGTTQFFLSSTSRSKRQRSFAAARQTGALLTFKRCVLGPKNLFAYFFWYTHKVHQKNINNKNTKKK